MFVVELNAFVVLESGHMRLHLFRAFRLFFLGGLESSVPSLLCNLASNFVIFIMIQYLHDFWVKC